MVGMTFNLEPSYPVSVNSDAVTSRSLAEGDRSTGRSPSATQLRFGSLTATESHDRVEALADLQSNASTVSYGIEAAEDTIGEQPVNPAELPIPDKAVDPSYYIQAAQVNHRAFLTTNLSGLEMPQVTVLSSTWLLGRSRNCAVVVQDRSVSRCHAVVGYDVQQGFYIMDVGSSNGTCLGGVRLAVLKRYPLKDGDVIAMCNLKIEFFIANDPPSLIQTF
jgi:FHA domain